MDVSKIRREFTVFVIDGASEQAHAMAETVKAAGYDDVQVYPTFESALAVARQNPPHLVLFAIEENEDLASEGFLIDLQAISSEILVTLLISDSQTLSALQLVGCGLAYDTVVRPMTSSLEVVQTLDRAAERLFFQFESEQLREQIEVPNLGSDTGSEMESTPQVASREFKEFNEFLSRMSSTKELDQSIQFFMEALSRRFGQTPILYFKYVPSHMSLLVAHAVWLPIDKIRSIGVDLKKEDPSLVPTLLSHPQKMEPLRQLVNQVFRRDSFTAFSHNSEGETLGLFVILDEVDVETDLVATGLRKLFDIVYDRNLTMKEKHALDTLDGVTGLINRRHFSQRTDEEISRSRRILMPVSLITIDIDRFKNLNERIGFRQADSVLKMVAMILKKTARVSDIVARTGTNEIVILLPHTGHMGAAIKAERIRRMVESTRFPLVESLGDGPLTISCGVSEYPGFCNDAESLVRSADEAMTQVKKSGGNKVCLATASPGFQADFIASPVPSATGSARRLEGSP